MDIDPERARKLCSEAEFELFTESRDEVIVEFTAEGLKKRAYQAQKLFELWNSRVSEQQSAGWGKVGEARKKAATGYITARQKAELFEDIWKRFDARLRAVIRDPNLVLKDVIKKRKETNKINKGTGKPLNKPGDSDPDKVWI
jgi:hypothetical protein